MYWCEMQLFLRLGLVIGWGLERLGLGSLVMGGLVESDGSFRSMLRRLVLVGWLVRRRDGR